MEGTNTVFIFCQDNAIQHTNQSKLFSVAMFLVSCHPVCLEVTH